MEVSVKVDSKKVIKVELKKEDTVRDLKEKLQNEEGVLIDALTMAYDGKILKDEDRIASIKIRKYSSLNLHFKLRGGSTSTRITVESEYLTIDPRASINDVKIPGVELHNLVIKADTKVLDGDPIDITNKDFQLFHKNGGPKVDIVIKVDHIKGGSILYSAYYWERISHIKQAIQGKHHVNFQETTLIWEGKLVKDDTCIMNIVKKRGRGIPLVFTATPRLRGGGLGFKVFLSFASQKKVCIEVEGSETVDSLKLKIKKELKVPVDDQLLSADGQVLHDGTRTIASYNVQRKRILALGYV